MARPKKTTLPTEQLTVRFPHGMLDLLRDHAEVDGRSLNAEIVQGLRHWIRSFSPVGIAHVPKDAPSL